MLAAEAAAAATVGANASQVQLLAFHSPSFQNEAASIKRSIRQTRLRAVKYVFESELNLAGSLAGSETFMNLARMMNEGRHEYISRSADGWTNDSGRTITRCETGKQIN